MSDLAFTLMTVFSALVDGAVAAAVLFGPLPGMRGADRRLGLARCVLAAFAVGAVFVPKVVVLAFLGLRFFGALQLLYVDLVIVLPLLGLAVLVADRRLRAGRVTAPARVLAVVALLLVPVGVYASWIEPYRLKLERTEVAIAAPRDGSEAVRIGVLADIQTDRVGEHERRAIARVLEEEPDIVLLPGDIFQGLGAAFNREVPALQELLRPLDAPGGVYAVLGDMDSKRRMKRILEGTKVRLLVNETAEVTVRDRRVRILGLDRYSWTDESYAAARAFESAPGEDDIRILMAHHPDPMLEMQPDSRIDLVVAGHTHGGQVTLPFFGPPITFSSVPRDVAAGGLHVLDGRRIYVSRGVGCERGQAPRIRFLCPPEVSVLDLR